MMDTTDYGLNNLEGILTILNVKNQTLRLESKLKNGTKRLDAEELECAKEIIELNEKYLQFQNNIRKLMFVSKKIRDDLGESLKYASKIGREGTTPLEGEKSVLDVLESKKLWVNESLKHCVEQINKSTENIKGVKLDNEIGLELKQFNLAIKECYEHTNIFHLYEASKTIFNIATTIYENTYTIIRKGYRSYDVTENYLTTLNQLYKAAEGNKGVKYKIDKTQLTVKKAKPIYNKK